MTNKTLIIIIIIIIITAVVTYKVSTPFNTHKTSTRKETNICNDALPEELYIQHMIKHHDVAVHMSVIQTHNTKNPYLHDILRNLIRLQNYEINLMKDNIKINNEDEMSDNDKKMSHYYTFTQGDFSKPNEPHISKTFCDPGFFNVSHQNKMQHMTDADYIRHMIPHHQVAIDMSKKILQQTNNDFIIYLAYRIIRNQQLEIVNLHNLLQSKNVFESSIL